MKTLFKSFILSLSFVIALGGIAGSALGNKYSQSIYIKTPDFTKDGIQSLPIHLSNQSPDKCELEVIKAPGKIEKGSDDVWLVPTDGGTYEMTVQCDEPKMDHYIYMSLISYSNYLKPTVCELKWASHFAHKSNSPITTGKCEATTTEKNDASITVQFKSRYQ